MGDEAGDKGQQGDQGDPKAGDLSQVKVMVGDEERVFSSDDVKTLIEKGSRVEKDLEGFSSIKKVLAQYDGISADEYVRNSEAAFAVANALIEKGVIDKEGNLIEKKVKDVKDPKGDEFSFKGLETGLSKKIDTILKAMTGITQEIDLIKEGQSNIYRRNISRDIKSIHSNLDDDDVSKLLGIAQADKSKSFYDHAEVMSKDKTAREGKQELSIAKKVAGLFVKAGLLKGDLDVDKLDLSALEKQDVSELPPLHEGKKFMFKSRKRKLGSSRKDLEDFITPATVMKESLDRNLG